MSSKIHVLPNNLVNLIAAGEVVERPASVLKELLDNSIDAGATQIKVYLEEGGMKGLKVIDNGCGMIPEDAKVAFLPHSTSKIKDEKDLENILTLGFRGEALASISSVSKVELVTKTSDSISGYRIFMTAGNLEEEGDIGATDGTSINIREIFFNTPARKKFLKTNSTELRHSIRTFTEIALANPEVGFELYHNDKRLFALPRLSPLIRGDQGGLSERRLVVSCVEPSAFTTESTINSLRERIRNLIGDDFVDNSFEVYYDGIIKISGFAGLPKIATNRKAVQIIIVNGRPITNSTIIAAAKESYHSAMPKNLYPQFVLNINVDPKKVDVNVHPRKLEIRFSEPQEIFKAVKSAIYTGLEKALQRDTEEKLSFSSSLPAPHLRGIRGEKEGLGLQSTNASLDSSTQFHFAQNDTKRYNLQNSKLKTPNSIKDSLNFTQSLLEPISDKPLPWEKETEDFPSLLRRGDSELSESGWSINDTTNYNLQTNNALFPAYQLLNAYIITTNGTTIQIIDQHAAAERVTYERLMKDFDSKAIQTQALLIPFELNLNAEERLILEENIDYLKSFGIEIEEFGVDSLVVREAPIELQKSDLNLFVKELLNDLVNKEDDEQNKLEQMKEKILTTMACHSSIRVGDVLTKEVIEKLIRDLKNCDLPYSCPHGRPIIYEVPVSELEKKFKRK